MVAIKELKEVVSFGLDLVNLGVSVGKDKKLDAADLGLLISSLPGLVASGIPAFSDLDKLPQELSDLSAEEASELVAFVGGKLLLDDVKAQKVLAKSLATVYAVAALVIAIVEPAPVAEA
jgi:hypothetical protein